MLSYLSETFWYLDFDDENLKLLDFYYIHIVHIYHHAFGLLHIYVLVHVVFVADSY